MRPKKIFIILFIGIFLLTSCGSDRKSSILNQRISEPTSWNNIVPGKTTKEEALTILKSMNIIDQKTITTNNIISRNFKSSITWSFITNCSDDHGEIYINNNLTILIIIAPKKNSVKFKDAIALYGNPEKVFAGSIPNEPLLTYILYPEQGVVFNHDYGNVMMGEEVKIHPNDNILEAYYFPPDQFKSAFLESDFFPVSTENYEMTVQDWQGYDKQLPVIIKYK